VTLVRAEFAQLPHLKNTLGVTCIHGETRQYPTTKLTLKTIKGTYSGPAGVVPDLPVPILIGHDFPLFSQLWLHLARGGQRKPRGPPSPPLPRPRRSAPCLCGFPDVDPQGSTDPLSEEESSAAAAEEEVGPVMTREEEGTPLGEEGAAPLGGEEAVPPKLRRRRGPMGQASSREIRLCPARGRQPHQRSAAGLRGRWAAHRGGETTCISSLCH